MVLAALVLAVFSVGATATAPAPYPAEGYHVAAPASWEVELTPGGETVVLNGTIESVRVQLLRHNPAWDAAQDAPSADGNAAAPTAGVGVGTPHRKRATDFGGGGYFCGAFLPAAPLGPLWDGLRYLRGIQGRVHLAPGPGACSRVSCSHKAAVFLCNDNNKDFYLNSWERVADGVSYIIGWCTKPGPEVSGQLFHPDKWNVIVRYDDC